MLSMSILEQVFAVKELDCKANRNKAICSGGQPVVGDTVTYKRAGGLICTGEVTEVRDFDSDKDRKGRMAIAFEPICGNLVLISTPVQIIGKL